MEPEHQPPDEEPEGDNDRWSLKDLLTDPTPQAARAVAVFVAWQYPGEPCQRSLHLYWHEADALRRHDRIARCAEREIEAGILAWIETAVFRCPVLTGDESD